MGKEQEENRETLKKALPGFMNKESPLDMADQDVPMWAIAIAVIAVVGFVVYAIYTLSRSLSEESAAVTKQQKKRAEKAAKKGKGPAVANGDNAMDDTPNAAREWFDWLVEQVVGLLRDLLVIALFAVLITEGIRYMPRVQHVSCDTVLGNSPGGQCVVVPGLEEPLECKEITQSRPRRGEWPTLEQHAARSCYRVYPQGVLKPSSRYFWDSSGVTWHKQSWVASMFNRPWANDRFVSLDKQGGAHVAIVAKSFEERITAFYAKYNPDTLSDTEKLDKLMAKYHKNPDEATKENFEAKTFSALHTKYDTGAMGSVVSPITGGIDAAGAILGSYRYVGRQDGLYERWSYFVTDVAPDYYYMFSNGDY